MNMKIVPRELMGKINAIISKSVLHRALICAAFSDKNTTLTYRSGINEDELSLDIEATIDCLKNTGTEFDFKEGSLTIKPIERDKLPKEYILDCKESGSTLRFLLPACAAFGRTFHVIGQGRLPDRPIDEIIDQMREHGCTIEEDALPLEVSGALRAGHFLLPGNVSSQYLSGFLFALPLLEKDSLIELTSKLESKRYVDMTIDELAAFNIIIKTDGKEYKIQGDQIYKSPGHIQIEGDWSNSAFWLTAGALSGKGITCTNLNLHSLQPDSNIYSILKDIGAEVRETETGLSVRKKNLDSIIMDASQYPDLVPVVAVILSVCRGRSEIINAGRLRIKESDRLQAITKNLMILGADIEEKPDGLIIKGVENLKGGTVNSYNDHRIVMAMAVASVVCEEELKIIGSEAVNKSYRRFFDDFNKLGGEANVI